VKALEENMWGTIFQVQKAGAKHTKKKEVVQKRVKFSSGCFTICIMIVSSTVTDRVNKVNKIVTNKTARSMSPFTSVVPNSWVYSQSFMSVGGTGKQGTCFCKSAKLLSLALQTKGQPRKTGHNFTYHWFLSIDHHLRLSRAYQNKLLNKHRANCDTFNYRGVTQSSSHETCQEDSTAMVQRPNHSPGRAWYSSPRRNFSSHCITTSVWHISPNVVPGQKHRSKRYPLPPVSVDTGLATSMPLGMISTYPPFTWDWVW
jgi:hypothetical protein